MKTKKLALAALNSLLANMEPEELKFIPATEANAKEAIATLESDIAKPVDPYGWQVQGLRDTFKGEFAEMDAKSEAARIGGTAYAFPLYTTPQESAAAGWMPIETAPEDGTYILLGSADGSWIARYYPKYTSGYRPENPWQSMMLNHENMGRFPKAKPTHWMPLPAAPGGAA